MRSIRIVAWVLFATVIAGASSLRVTAPITINATWDTDTVFLADSIVVDPGVTLTIAPGTRVIAASLVACLNVKGVIKAIGTSTDSIWFQSSSPTSRWVGIHFNVDRNRQLQMDSSTFEYCFFKNGEYHISIKKYQRSGFFYCGFSSKVVISKSQVWACGGFENGGAIYCDSASVLMLNDVVFCNNNCPGKGGAVFTRDTVPVYIKIVDSWFVNNRAQMGGAIAVGSGTECEITSSVFWGDTARRGISYSKYALGGGAIVIQGAKKMAVKNSLFVKNYSTCPGGAIYSVDSDVKLINISVGENTATKGGGIIFVNKTRSSSPQLINSVVYANELVDPFSEDTCGRGVFVDTGLSATFSYCALPDSLVGPNGDPVVCMFEHSSYEWPSFKHEYEQNPDDSLSDYWMDTILSNPALNSGTPDTTGLGLGDVDLAGNPRVHANRIDMGAFESFSSSTTGIETIVKAQLNPELINGYLVVYNAKGQEVFKGIERCTVSEFRQKGTGLWAKGIYFFNVIKAGRCVTRGKFAVQ